MLVLTITNDNCIRIGDQQIRVSLSPFEKRTAEFWIWPAEPSERTDSTHQTHTLHDPLTEIFDRN